MARKMRKFADGGATDRNQSRYDRKVADIQSDFEKWKKSGKYGNEAVARAKMEQRMADAKNDLAGWRGEDRTATRAAERAAESALSMARKTKGRSITDRDAVESRMSASDDLSSKLPSVADIKPMPRLATASAPATRRAAPAKPSSTSGTSSTPAADKVFSRLPAEARRKPASAGKGTGVGVRKPTDTRRKDLTPAEVAAFANAKPGRLPRAAGTAPYDAAAARAAFGPRAASFKDLPPQGLGDMRAKGGKIGGKKFGKGGATNVEPKGFKPQVRVKLPDPKPARTPKEEGEREYMQKKYPFNKYAKGGATESKKAMELRHASTLSKLASEERKEASEYKKGGAMKKYAKGGSVSSRADGVAKKGRTSTTMVKMAKGGACGMRKGGKTKGCK